MQNNAHQPPKTTSQASVPPSGKSFGEGPVGAATCCSGVDFSSAHSRSWSSAVTFPELVVDVGADSCGVLLLVAAGAATNGGFSWIVSEDMEPDVDRPIVREELCGVD